MTIRKRGGSGVTCAAMLTPWQNTGRAESGPPFFYGRYGWTGGPMEQGKEGRGWRSESVES
jgi:hypothetical protein